ncbi:MAG: hypothetical protein JHC93_01295 [Parachlamydiales bacterium]|nr:hypothetical protein [Parachlamydiales bacterium]
MKILSQCRFILLALSLFFYSFVGPEDDLEEVFKQDIVIETKRIVLPEYPLAFNPGIIRWNGGILMSFRIIPDPKSTFTSLIGLVQLDNEFNVIGKPQLLKTREEKDISPSRAEDARLFTVKDRLYVTYDDCYPLKINKAGFRVYIAEIVFNNNQFELKDAECLNDFEGQSPDIREKNWVPFEFGNQMYLAYSLKPHTIFRPLLGSGSCETVERTNNSIKWPWGILRGSTSAMLDNGQYLAFFHSSTELVSAHSKGRKSLHYFMGAYTFSASPPFFITSISKDPIVGPGFYNGEEYKHYWKPVHVVFPCGYIFDHEFIWLAYGRQDHEMWVAKINKTKLYESLDPVYLTK